MTGAGTPGHVTVSVEAVAFVGRLIKPEVRGAKGVLRVTVAEGTTVEALIRSLAEHHPAFGEQVLRDGNFSGLIQVIIGDRLLELAGGWGRILQDGDSLVLLPPFEGG